jgi:hypothetical protein
VTINSSETQAPIVLGQKYAYATASLVLGVACFINLVGMEKAILAIIFAWLALKPKPAPALNARRGWAKAGLVLGGLMLMIVPTVLVLNFDRISTIIDCFAKLSNGK